MLVELYSCSAVSGGTSEPGKLDEQDTRGRGRGKDRSREGS
jgi:hypothetical protein